MYKTTSGHVGISYHRKAGKWMAQTTRHGRTIYLGLYATKREAILAHKIKTMHLPSRHKYCGATYYKRNRKWGAWVRERGVVIYVGLYATRAAALRAAKKQREANQ